MFPTLKLSRVCIEGPGDCGRVFDMTRRCAFAMCTSGEFDVRILNECYRVGARSLLACMPFVDVRVVGVSSPGEVVFGYIDIVDVPKVINRWVNTSNLSVIQCHPLVGIGDYEMELLNESIRRYAADCDESVMGSGDDASDAIRRDIAEYQCQLIVARVVKIFLDRIPMDVCGHTHGDVVFQKFMLALYAHIRVHRDVRFYAMRSGLSLKYFSTVVRKLSGTSPSGWIESVLLSEAKILLDDGDMSIKDIAVALNFPDAPTFSKYFRRVSGMTPREYRRSG